MPKFIFVTGGVLSSLGKGVFASSLGKLLKSRGINVAMMKIDVYLNVDAGTLNPFEHGECFVTRDGFECDLDIGNYERFLDEYAVKEQNMMMGSVYEAVVRKERRGAFLGKTIQMIPHVTNEIKRRVFLAAKKTKADVLIVELGGTVGDIESEPVLEAIRQLKFELSDNLINIHLALVPTIITGEQKTKPLQHSVRRLLSAGIAPEIVVARTEKVLGEEEREKISLFSNVPSNRVFYSQNVWTVYELPMLLEKQGLDKEVGKLLGLKLKERDLKSWRKLLSKAKTFTKIKRVAVVGKYARMKDTYISVFEALFHASVHAQVKIVADLVNSELLEKNGYDALKKYDGVIVPGGFGGRGVEGIIGSIKYARESNKPFLGLCYGLQLAIVESARNILGWKDANSAEINPQTKHPVIDLLPEQKRIKNKGGTMRLGAKEVLLKKGTLAYSLYKEKIILKRFRHRYEINPIYVGDFESAGWVFSGRDPQKEIMKVGELKGHKFFVGVQYHPEFDSRLERPEPLFLAFAKSL